MPAKMRRGRPLRSKLPPLVIPTALLFSSTLISPTTASTEFSFFEHSSCNAGTAFYQLTDPNPLTIDLNCHQMPAGSVALYISDIDEGCTIRTYNTPNCDPSSLSGLLVNSGTCFYADAHEAVMLSWRADCAGVDYEDSNGADHGNSYSSSSVSDDGSGGGSAPGGEDTAGSALVASILATATGPVTVSADVQNAITKTVVPVKETANASSSVSGAVDSSRMGSATATATSTTFSSVSNDADRLYPRSGLGWGSGGEMGLASSLGLVFAAAAFLV